jgi:hypothetical protein
VPALVHMRDGRNNDGSAPQQYAATRRNGVQSQGRRAIICRYTQGPPWPPRRAQMRIVKTATARGHCTTPKP